MSAQGLICHDYFAISGGGENLAATLAEGLNFSLTGGFVNTELQLANQYPLNHIHSLNAYQGFAPLQILSLIKQWKSYYHTEVSQIIYSGVYAPLAVHQHQQALNILYCHTPPRFVYDKQDFYLQQLPLWQRPVLKLIAAILKSEYEKTLPLMDLIITNSKHVQSRVKNYLGYDSRVIYPPCRLSEFRFEDQQDYYLSTARLDKLKRVDEIIKAFKKMPDKKLIIASGGPEYQNLVRLAGDAKNIEFTNWISRKKLVSLINNCLATIYIPRDEDFGISPIESMAAGKAVIGVREGGLQETIIDEQTGFLLNPELSLSKQLQNRISTLNHAKLGEFKNAAIKQAEQFSEQAFINQIRSCLH